MALSIYTNIYAFKAQASLGTANNLQAKSLERLSTGLRINDASDDASGLAISEKLRGQISGLKRASINAQDGISYLQTAEGSMEEVTNMLQRMREISVQAGNGIYTTNDRAMLQLEVDQLKEEINRVTKTSEFNTKKLLNGDGAALWSSDNPGVGAIVNGPNVIPGNYKVETSVTPGKNTIYGTNIMSVKKGVLVSEVTSDPNPTGIVVRDPDNIPTTNVDMDIVIGDTPGAAQTASAKVTKTFLQKDSNWHINGASANATTNFSGYVEMEITSLTPTTGVISYKYRVLDSKTGNLSNWVEATVAGGAVGATAQFTLDLSKLDNTVYTGRVTLNMPRGATILSSGDKVLATFQPKIPAAENWARSGGGTITIGDGPRLNFSAVGSLTKLDNGDVYEDYNKIKTHMGNLDPKTGVVDWGSLTIEIKENVAGTGATPGTGQTLVGTSKVRVRDEGAATKDTKLSNLSSFTNADGRMILDITQELKIFVNGKNTSIFLEADDTIGDLEQKLTEALVYKLNAGADDRTTEGQIVNKNLVNFVANLHTTESTNEAVAGTFVIQSSVLGVNSSIVFSGDQALINALGIEVTQKGENSVTDVKISDAHTGKLIGRDEISDGKLRTVIPGIDVSVRQDVGVEKTWNDDAKRLEFISQGTKVVSYLHVIDNRTELQIGANQGQTLNVSVGQLDTTGLDVDDVYVTDIDYSQKAITKIDKAIEKLNATRATIGAQVNRLEYSINNLGTASENLTAAESRIRDLDVAAETTQLSRNQILVQASTAMLAQANQMPQNALRLLQ